MKPNEKAIGGAQGIGEAIVRNYAVENIDRFEARNAWREIAGLNAVTRRSLS